MNVLILDGNENQAVACARSLGRAGRLVQVGSPSPWCKAGMSRWCRKTFVYRDPREDAKNFISTVLEEARKYFRYPDPPHDGGHNFPFLLPGSGIRRICAAGSTSP